MNNIIFIHEPTENPQARFNSDGDLEIICTPELERQLKELVIATEEAARVRAQDFYAAMQSLNAKLKSAFDELAGELTRILPVKNYVTVARDNKQHFRAYRLVQHHRAQQQLQRASYAQGANNRHWIKHRRRKAK